MGDGKKLKEILDSKGTNVRQIAKATGISATTLYLYLIAKLFYLRPVFLKHLAFPCIKSHDNRRAYAL